MAVAATMTQQINLGKSLPITYQSFMTRNIVQADPETFIIINVSSILEDYGPQIKSHIQKYRFSDQELQKYEYRANLFCYDRYGTIEVVPFLLAINHMVSEMEFCNFRELNIFDGSFGNILNEIYIRERKNLNKARAAFEKELGKI